MRPLGSISLGCGDGGGAGGGSGGKVFRLRTKRLAGDVKGHSD